MLTVVIPTYTIDSFLEEMALKCAKSYRYQADRIVIIEDGGKFSPKLLSVADCYIYNQKNEGFTKNVNHGWKYALSLGADYVAIASSDTYLVSGDINELCVPGKVTSPEVVSQFIERLAGNFFVVPKEIAEERGFLLEEMVTYCSDSEYDQRVQDIFQKVDSVKIYHHMAQTVTASGIEGKIDEDRAAYNRLKEEGRAK